LPSKSVDFGDLIRDRKLCGYPKAADSLESPDEIRTRRTFRSRFARSIAAQRKQTMDHIGAAFAVVALVIAELATLKIDAVNRKLHNRELAAA
jgi:hypothetical protein